MTRTKHKEPKMKRTTKASKPVETKKVRKKTGPKPLCENPEVVKTAEELVGKLGARNKELAQWFGVDETTIAYWIKNYPNFAEAVKRGRVRCSLQVSKALYRKAIGATITEQQVIKNEITEYHENGRIKKRYTEPIVVEVEKQLPPDAYAAHKYLTIIMREIWAENTTHNINHNVNGEIAFKKIEELSFDELSEPIKNMLFDLNMKQLSDAQSN